MAEAREQIEAYRGRLGSATVDAALELLRSIQGMGPRRHPGNWHWVEPEVQAGGDLLELIWPKGERTLVLGFWKGDTSGVNRMFVSENGRAAQGQMVGLAMAAEDVVQYLCDGRD